MTKRSLDLHKIEVAKHLRRVSSATSGPVGIQWFADVRFAEPHWYRDRSTVRTAVDALAAASWCRELDVFAPGHRAGTPFASIEDVRGSIETGEPATAMFAHGEPRMTVDIQDAEAALAFDVIEGRLELRVWLGPRIVEQYKTAVLDDIIALLAALKAAAPDAVVAKALAHPDPSDGLRYRRMRPLRVAGRALDAVVDVVDRDASAESPGWAREARAMVDASVPAVATRIERERLVILRWIDDPSSWHAVADACSQHEQWLVRLLPTRLAPGWNEAGDVEVVDAPPLLDAPASGIEALAKRKPGPRPPALVAASREAALALVETARRAGYARVVYRDPAGTLWDPAPPGDWISGWIER